MNAAVVTISLDEMPLVKTMAEYHAKVKENNQWYYSQEAIAFRMWTKMCICLRGKATPEEIQNIVLYCLDTERRDQENGIPENLRGE